MEQSRRDREHSLRFLTVRALAATLLVLALLLSLKLGGFITVDPDAPVQVLDEDTQTAVTCTGLAADWL